MRLIFLYLAIFLLLLPLPAPAQTAARPGLLQKLADLPAPAPFDPPEKEAEKKERPADFMDEENVPPDDAPIEDLLDYWTQAFPNPNIFPTSYRPTPSPTTIERILEHCEDNPEKLPRYLGIFPPKPDIADTIKEIYDKKVKDDAEVNYEFTRVKEWLKFNSRYYLDELVKSANEVKDENNYVQNPNQHVLRSLAKVDWDTAAPIVQRLENDPTNPYSSILAKWITYQHARDTGDSSTESSYRSELQKIVENKKATWAQRDLAMDALVLGGDFDGRDEWYMGLLEDETLLKIQDNGYTGLTTLMNLSPRKKWIERMIELSESSTLSVRTAAARNLMRLYKEGNKEVLTALIPWLSNPAWATESRNGERAQLIKALGETVVPESVPSLIAVVMNEEDNRSAAATALVKYKDPRAVPALRTVLATKDEPEERNVFIGALVASGGFSGEEQIMDLEAYATLISTPAGEAALAAYEENDNEALADDEEEGKTRPKPRPLPLSISIGKFLAGMEEPPDVLVVKAIARLKVLKRTNPPVAIVLADIMAKWKGKAVYLELLRQVRSGEADVETILTLLAGRAAIREALPGEIAALRSSLGMPRGIGSCIGENPAEYLAILGQADADAQTAMLGCARLLRAALPVSEVAELLNSTNKLLVVAAERYLESEDSLAARKVLLDRNKGGALILGARTAFIPDVKSVHDSPALNELFNSVTDQYFRTGKASELKKREDELRKEMAGNPSMLAVYAVLTPGESDNYVVRLYNDRAVFTFYENEARYWERTLTPTEYEGLYAFLLDNNIDAMKPELGTCEHECVPGEFVMFGRDGGRRVYYESAPSNDPKLEKLQEIFDEFRKGEVKLRYRLGDKTPGLEVLFADEKFPVKTVWKKEADLRFVVEDVARGEEIEKELNERRDAEFKLPATDDATRSARYEADRRRRLEAMFQNYSWRTLENGKLSEAVAQPADAPYLYDQTQAPEMPGIQSDPRAWKVRTPRGEIRVGDYENPGLFRVAPGQPPVSIKDGNYRSPLVTADGKWAVAVKEGDESDDFSGLVRVNLQTGRELPVNLPAAESIVPVAFVNSHNKVLVYRGKSRDYDPEEEGEGEGVGMGDGDEEEARPARPDLTPAIPEYYLLDAATGALQRVRGEFRPLELQAYRPLQPTGVASEFWAAIYDERTRTSSIGRYSDRTFTFRPVLNIPNIELLPMTIWVDEPGGKVYFAYQGHLLSLPLK